MLVVYLICKVITYSYISIVLKSVELPKYKCVGGAIVFVYSSGNAQP